MTFPPNQSTGPASTRRAFLQLAGVGGAMLALGGLPTGSEAAEPGAILKRPIPSSGEPLPVIGLGTWQQFDVAADSAEMVQLQEVLAMLFAGGGSVIDSSPMYGRAEARVGDLLRRMHARDKAFLATKVWTRGHEQGLREMRRSMELMDAQGTLDLMQVHNLVDTETQLASMAELKQAGAVRYLGVTHYTTSAFDELIDVLTRHKLDFVQLPYSIAEPDAERRLLPFAREHGVAVLVNVPYGKGDLFRLVRGKALPDWVLPFAASWGQFFLKYLLAEPAVTCIIPGTSNPKHMADNLGAGHGRLPDAGERKRMRDLVAAL